ncbi:MAG TPA: TonB family protein, partial [Longimicrobiaceae bacterium]|nr:TonB family protein [Longimicrobiaceae bacterium]
AVWVLPLSVFALLLPPGLDLAALLAAVWAGIAALRRSGGFTLPSWQTLGLTLMLASLAATASVMTRLGADGGGDDIEVYTSVFPDKPVPPPFIDTGTAIATDTVMAVATGIPGVRAAGVYAVSEVDVQPELLNRDQVSAILDATYPAHLRAAGVTATTLLFFQVDEEGRVVKESVAVDDGTHPDFAAAARAVAGEMRFRPAQVDGHPVAVEVTLPLSWSVDG